MKWVCLLLLATTLASTGCHRNEAKGTAVIQAALTSAGLDFVGEAPDLPNRTVADHRSEFLTFPSQIVKGRQYIFHRKRDPRFSWVAVEECLKRGGATIVDAPRGNVGLSYTYLGGPLYIIEFRVGEMRYTFQNSMAIELESRRLGAELEQVDFVLRRE